MRTWLDGLTRPHRKYELNPKAWLVLVFLSLAAMVPGLFSIPAMDRDEARYAQASRQMIETGDYVDIQFQDMPRHVKPAGIYWMQVLSSAPFGGADAPIGAFRLPSFLSSLIAVMLTAWMGARLFSPSVGLVAGMVLAVSLGLQVEARTSKTDAALLASGIMAQLGLIMILTQVKAAKPKFWGWPAVMWVGTGLALLIKGPIIAMVTAFTLFGYVALKRDISLIWKTRPLIGLSVAAVIFLPWLVAINIQTDWEFFREAVGHALFGKVGKADDSHGGPFGYHTLLIPVTLWPGAALIGLAGLVAWVRRREDIIQLLLLWLLPSWFVFEIVQTKLPHYVLPTFPAIAVLIGLGVQDARALLSGARPKALHFTLVGVSALMALVLGAVPYLVANELGVATTVFTYISASAGGLVALTIILMGLKPELPRIILSAACAGVLYTCVFGIIVPGLTKLFPSHEIARFVDDLGGCDDIQLITAGYREPSNVFNSGTNTILARDGVEAAQALLESSTCRLAAIDKRVEDVFRAEIIAQRARLISLGRISGFNAVKGDELNLTLYILDGSDIRLP